MVKRRRAPADGMSSGKLTLRISLIPESITEREFLRILESFVDENTPDEEKTATKNTIILWSYASTATSADCGFCVATVTFREIPSVLLHSQTIDLKGAEDPIRVLVDSHFIGLTPLNCPLGEATVE